MPRNNLLTIGDNIIETPMHPSSQFRGDSPFNLLKDDYLRRGATWTMAPAHLGTHEPGDEVDMARSAGSHSETKGEIVGRTGNWSESRNYGRPGGGGEKRGRGEKSCFLPSPFSPSPPPPPLFIRLSPQFSSYPRSAPGSAKMAGSRITRFQRAGEFCAQANMDLVVF